MNREQAEISQRVHDRLLEVQRTLILRKNNEIEKINDYKRKAVTLKLELGSMMTAFNELDGIYENLERKAKSWG